MIESVFLTLFAVGFITFLFGYEKDSVIYNGLSILMFIIILAAHFNIEVPLDTFYHEPVFYPISLVFIIINVLVMLIRYLDFKDDERFRLR